MNTEKITIEIWSDVVCPFCFVGKKKLEQAINKLGATNKVEIVWRSFQLDPEFAQAESAPCIEYLSTRKGYPVNQVKAMCEQLTVQGKNYGIDFKFDQALTINTLNIHQLIHWAKTFNRSNELKEAFMIAYFTEGVDLSKATNLYAIVKKVGLNVDKAKEVLESNTYLQDVRADIEKARTLGVRGVPFFLINDKQMISGAQDDQVFEQTISAALKSAKPTKIRTE